MLETLQNRVILVLITFVSATILSTFVLYFYIQGKAFDYSHFKHSVENTNTLILKDVAVIRDFFENETINSDFFLHRKSKVLEHHARLSHKIDHAIRQVDSLQTLNAFGLNVELIDLENDFSAYDSLIKVIVKQILTRGFKDYGLEGKMRECAHQLEKYDNEIGLINILQLRRHEKDFIIRQESQYLTKHSDLIKVLVSGIHTSGGIPEERKKEIVTLLNSYQNYFITLSRYEKQIGIKNSIGLKQAIDNKVDGLEATLQSIISKSDELEINGHLKLKAIFLFVLAIFVVVLFIFARLIARRITGSIVELKEKISEFVASDFTLRNILPVKDTKFEIDALANNFSLMEQHILNQMNALKKSNEELSILIDKASHDIKKPLMDIKDYNEELILISNIDTSATSHIKHNKAWQKILSVINELSLVKDIKSEEILIEKIDLDTLIKSTFQEHKALPLYANIIFSLNFSLKVEFYSSRELLRIIFFQLFENAILYSCDRNGHSSISVTVESEGKYMIKVTITDNGIGIKKEDHEKVFTMFYRTQNKQEGTGLGLYIVQNSLEKINGAISLESDENKGSRFTLLLPNKLHFEKSRKTIQEDSQLVPELRNMVLNFI